jgi:hypothetical protein
VRREDSDAVSKRAPRRCAGRRRARPATRQSSGDSDRLGGGLAPVLHTTITDSERLGTTRNAAGPFRLQPPRGSVPPVPNLVSTQGGGPAPSPSVPGGGPATPSPSGIQAPRLRLQARAALAPRHCSTTPPAAVRLRGPGRRPPPPARARARRFLAHAAARGRRPAAHSLACRGPPIRRRGASRAGPAGPANAWPMSAAGARRGVTAAQRKTRDSARGARETREGTRTEGTRTEGTRTEGTRTEGTRTRPDR